MFKRIIIGSMLGLCLWAGSGWAGSLYWDPRFPGEGWSFDNQDDLLGVTRYTYDGGGTPVYQIGALQLSWIERDGYLLKRGSGEVFQVVGRDQSASIGSVSIEASTVNGVEIINVNAPGFTRRLEPFVFNYSETLDRYNGVWVSSMVADDDAEVNLIRFEDRFGTISVGGAPIRVKYYRSVFYGTEGVVGFDSVAKRYVVIEDAGGGDFLIASLSELNDSAFGEGAYFNAQGQQISDDYIIHVSSPAPTTRSGDLLLQTLNLGKRAGRRGIVAGELDLLGLPVAEALAQLRDAGVRGTE